MQTLWATINVFKHRWTVSCVVVAPEWTTLKRFSSMNGCNRPLMCSAVPFPSYFLKNNETSSQVFVLALPRLLYILTYSHFSATIFLDYNLFLLVTDLWSEFHIMLCMSGWNKTWAWILKPVAVEWVDTLQVNLHHRGKTPSSPTCYKGQSTVQMRVQ